MLGEKEAAGARCAAGSRRDSSEMWDDDSLGVKSDASTPEVPHLTASGSSLLGSSRSENHLLRITVEDFHRSSGESDDYVDEHDASAKSLPGDDHCPPPSDSKNLRQRVALILQDNSPSRSPRYSLRKDPSDPTFNTSMGAISLDPATPINLEKAQAVFRVNNAAPNKAHRVKVAFYPTEHHTPGNTPQPKRLSPSVSNSSLENGPPPPARGKRGSRTVFLQSSTVPLKPNTFPPGYIVLINADGLTAGDSKALRQTSRIVNIVLFTAKSKAEAEALAIDFRVHCVVYNMRSWYKEVVVGTKTAYSRPRLLKSLEESCGGLGRVLIIEPSIDACRGYRQNTVLCEDHLRPKSAAGASIHNLVSELVNSELDVPNYLFTSPLVSLQKRAIQNGAPPTSVAVLSAAADRPSTAPPLTHPGLSRASSWWQQSEWSPGNSSLNSIPLGPEQALPLVDPLLLPS
ncbi:hypothetical protein DIPPA_31959 [Diplonema papillatum]|nr:hypothetical protein DIPPA_31959 [Diplonema papillatum]